MKLLYLDCSMGIAGDMLMGALLELVPNKREMGERLNHMGLEDVTVKAEKSVKCGIVGTHMNVRIHGEEEHSHDVKSEHHHHAQEAGVHEKHHHHELPCGETVHVHHHHHASLEHVLHIIEHL